MALPSAGNETRGHPYRGERVATRENEGGNAGLRELRLERTGPAGEPNHSARAAQRPRRRHRLACIYLVRRAQARELGAGGFERLNHRVATSEAVVAGRLDAAGGEEILGEACPRGEVRGRAEIGEEYFRPRTGVREHPIGSVAKRFERLDEANARQGFERQRGGRWQHDRVNAEYRHRRFREIGEIAGAGERVLAPGYAKLARGAHGRDFLLDHALFERGPGPTRPLDFLELGPGCAAELFSHILDAAGPGGGVHHPREV